MSLIRTEPSEDRPERAAHAGRPDAAAVLARLREVLPAHALLSRRGEDQRLFDERESVKRRRKLDAEYHAAKEAERLTRMASEGYSADKGPSEEGEDD